MLGAILVILSLIAGAAYVAKIGTGFTLLFIGAVVFMAYKRLPLIAFTVVFTLLLAGYTYIAPPAGIWKGFLWVLLAALWLFNLRPLRKAIISRPFLRAYMRRCEPDDLRSLEPKKKRSRPAPCGGTASSSRASPNSRSC